MSSEVKNYLDEIRSHLRLDPRTERQVIGELCSHFHDKLSELDEEGLGTAEAERRAIESFGRPSVVARMLGDAFGRGSWSDAVMATMPHVLMAILFATHLWVNAAAGIAVWACIVLVTLAGWWKGKPSWLYSWVGYSMAPILVAGYLSFGLPVEAVRWVAAGFHGTMPGIPMLLVTVGFYALALLIICRLTIRVVKRDWILASLMTAPLPIIGGWLFFVGRGGGLLNADSPPLHVLDTSMAMGLLALAAGSATFIRLRKRAWKIVALVLVASTTPVALSPALFGVHGFLPLAFFFLLMVGFILSPAIVESKVGHGEREEDNWWARYWTEEVPSISRRS